MSFSSSCRSLYFIFHLRVINIAAFVRCYFNLNLFTHLCFAFHIHIISISIRFASSLLKPILLFGFFFFIWIVVFFNKLNRWIYPSLKWRVKKSKQITTLNCVQYTKLYIQRDHLNDYSEQLTQLVWLLCALLIHAVEFAVSAYDFVEFLFRFSFSFHLIFSFFIRSVWLISDYF